MSSYDRPLYGNPSTSYHRFNREGVSVDESNLHLQRPDGYETTSTVWIPFMWLGCIDECGTHYQALKEMVRANNGSAVGLKFELANTPNRVEAEAVWWENMLPVEGLKVKLSLQDIDHNVITDIGEIDLGCDPRGSSLESCDGCSGGDDTFGKYRFDRSGNKMSFGRCQTARLVLEITSEPEDGLLGSDCSKMCPIMFRGGFGYEAFCIHRGLLSFCGMNFSCLDGCGG